MYYQPQALESDDVIIMNEIRCIYKEKPFYGYRRITVELRKQGYLVNHKRVQRLLKDAGIKAIYPGKRTTIRNPLHKVFPYLLRDIKIERPNQVWQVDITYIKISNGWVYLVCLIDVFSRKIMGWNLTTFLDTQPCLDLLENALEYATPEIINSDQGCQFTSMVWVNILLKQNILISMDGKGRWADNIFIERFWRSLKYESAHLHSFETVQEARDTLGKYIAFYNQERCHQALNYHTPDFIYENKKIPTKKELFAGFAIKNIYALRGLML